MKNTSSDSKKRLRLTRLAFEDFRSHVSVAPSLACHLVSAQPQTRNSSESWSPILGASTKEMAATSQFSWSLPKYTFWAALSGTGQKAFGAQAVKKRLGVVRHLSFSISLSAEVLLWGLLIANDLDSPKSAILTKPDFWATSLLPPSKGTPAIIRFAGFKSR